MGDETELIIIEKEGLIKKRNYNIDEDKYFMSMIVVKKRS